MSSHVVDAGTEAIPLLIGWTPATGSIDPPALMLFAILFLWQVPHFLAIALFRRTEFARAGLLVRPNEPDGRSEEHTSELQSLAYLVCRLLLEKKKSEHPHTLAALDPD